MCWSADVSLQICQVIDAGAYEGKLPAFLYEEFVNEDNKIVIPCGKPVECGTMTPLGPFGPLAANHSEMLGFDFTANNHGVQWHPVLYPCGDGAYAHAVVTVIACIILLPLAFAARARKASKANTSSSSTASRGSSDDDDESAGPWASLVNKYWIECAHLLAIFLIFLSLATQAATQSALASEPEVRPDPFSVSSSLLSFHPLISSLFFAPFSVKIRGRHTAPITV